MSLKWCCSLQAAGSSFWHMVITFGKCSNIRCWTSTFSLLLNSCECIGKWFLPSQVTWIWLQRADANVFLMYLKRLCFQYCCLYYIRESMTFYEMSLNRSYGPVPEWPSACAGLQPLLLQRVSRKALDWRLTQSIRSTSLLYGGRAKRIKNGVLWAVPSGQGWAGSRVVSQGLLSVEK